MTEESNNSIIADLKKQISLLEAVHQAASILMTTSTDDFSVMIKKSMEVIAKAVKVDRMYVWKNHLVNGEPGCSQIYEWSENAEPQQGNQFTTNIIFKEAVPPWMDILQKNKCINSLVKNLSAKERAALEPQGIISILVAPVFINNIFWGIVGFDDCFQERIFTDTEETILHSASSMIANAIYHDKTARQLDERKEENQVIFFKLPIGLTVFDEELNIIDCNNAVLEIFGTEKDYYLEHFYELSPEYQPDGMNSKHLIQDIFKQALAGENKKMNWVFSSPNLTLIPCEITMARIKYKNKPRGLAFIYNLSREKNLERNVQHLREQAYTDPLTGIYNRRYFDEESIQIIRTLSKNSKEFSLMMIDIDYFKKYNDRYGHQDGDECLKKIAGILNAVLNRSNDFVARYGGEEFVAVLPYTDMEGACFLAKKILSDVKNANIIHEASDIAPYVTLSIGIVSGKVHHSQTIAEYIKTADQMLYASKQEGRNRYTFTDLHIKAPDR